MVAIYQEVPQQKDIQELPGEDESPSLAEFFASLPHVTYTPSRVPFQARSVEPLQNFGISFFLFFYSCVTPMRPEASNFSWSLSSKRTQAFFVVAFLVVSNIHHGSWQRLIQIPSVPL